MVNTITTGPERVNMDITIAISLNTEAKNRAQKTTNNISFKENHREKVIIH
jgi:hypothetical protein